MRMGASNVENFVIPIDASSAVGPVTVVRPGPRPRLLPDGVRYVDTDGGNGVTRFLRTLLGAARVALRDRPDLIVSFNATPYGAIAALVGVVLRVPFHVGFVGSDALTLAERRSGRVLDRLLRRAALVTVPGDVIGSELERRRYPADRIHELPHTVDLARFAPGAEERDIDVLFVGSFIERKQVDVLISAVGIVAEQRGALRCVLVGEGPLEEPLRRQVAAGGLEESVEFIGYQQRPEAYFARADVIAITSSWEGFPFVLVMGMCCGAVPMATRVGSIGDLLSDDVDGVLLEDDRPQTVAAAITGLLDDRARLERLRTAVLDRRDEFGFGRAERLWDEWIEGVLG